jgi:ketosteroid isomerase-like protein
MIIADPTPETAADIAAINQLQACYCEAVSRGAIDDAVMVYAEDGVLRSPTTADAVGRAAIAEVITTTTSSFDFIFQGSYVGIVRVDGDRAWARFPVVEWNRRTSDGKSMHFLGFYDDELVRTAEGWRFAVRRLVARAMARPEGFTGKIHDLSSLDPALGVRGDDA